MELDLSRALCQLAVGAFIAICTWLACRPRSHCTKAESAARQQVETMLLDVSAIHKAAVYTATTPVASATSSIDIEQPRPSPTQQRLSLTQNLQTHPPTATLTLVQASSGQSCEGGDGRGHPPNSSGSHSRDSPPLLASGVGVARKHVRARHQDEGTHDHRGQRCYTRNFWLHGVPHLLR